jgi:hypothetical protein
MNDAADALLGTLSAFSGNIGVDALGNFFLAILIFRRFGHGNQSYQSDACVAPCLWAYRKVHLLRQDK